MPQVWNVETSQWEEIDLPEWDDLDYPYAFCPPPPALTEEEWDIAFADEFLALVEDDLFLMEF